MTSPPLRNLRSAFRNGPGLYVDHEHAVAALLFFLVALLVSADLVPTLDRISIGDESNYIDSGRLLVDEGKLRIFAWSPLAMALYGLAYLPFQDSPNWFVNTAAGGRVVTLILFWFAVYMCGRSVSSSVSPIVVMVLAAVWLPLIPFLGNLSDALFMAMSGLALWNIVEYRSDNSLKRLAVASCLVGLSACARNDGLLLFVSFLLLTAWFTRWSGEGRAGRAVRIAAVSGLPFLIIVGGYVLAHGFSTGEFGLGTSTRTYYGFVDGHARSYPERNPGPVAYNWAAADVQEVFGARVEDEWFIFNAIRRNPGAFFDRTVRQLRVFPSRFDAAYGGIAAVLLFLVARGVIRLWKSRQGWLLGLALIWHLHLLPYSVTFWNQRYFQFLFIFLMIIGAVGAAAIISNFGAWRERAAVLAALAGAAALGVLFDGLSGAVPAVLFAGAVCYELAQRFAPALLAGGPFRGLLAAVLCVSVVTVGLIGSKASLPLPPEPSPEGRALQYLVKTVPEGTVVAAYGQKIPYAARMLHRQLPDTLGDLEGWLREHRIRAVYLDPAYKSRAPEVWQTLMDNAGPNGLLSTGYSDPGTDTYVLLPPASSP